MSLSAREVLTTLQGAYSTSYNMWNEIMYRLEEPKEILGNTYSVVDSYGGEGQGDSAHVVIRVTDIGGNSQYFRKDGYYASYDGFTWDGDFYEVKPKEKVVTFYEDAVGEKIDAYDQSYYNSYGDEESYL